MAASGTFACEEKKELEWNLTAKTIYHLLLCSDAQDEENNLKLFHKLCEQAKAGSIKAAQSAKKILRGERFKTQLSAVIKKYQLDFDKLIADICAGKIKQLQTLNEHSRSKDIYEILKTIELPAKEDATLRLLVQATFRILLNRAKKRSLEEIYFCANLATDHSNACKIFAEILSSEETFGLLNIALEKNHPLSMVYIISKRLTLPQVRYSQIVFTLNSLYHLKGTLDKKEEHELLLTLRSIFVDFNLPSIKPNDISVLATEVIDQTTKTNAKAELKKMVFNQICFNERDSLEPQKIHNRSLLKAALTALIENSPTLLEALDNILKPYAQGGYTYAEQRLSGTGFYKQATFRNKLIPWKDQYKNLFQPHQMVCRA